MSSEHLVAMANDIGAYFAFEPDKGKAVQGIVAHLERFWEPRMRRKLIAHFQQNADDGLAPLVRSAVGILAALGETGPVPHV